MRVGSTWVGGMVSDILKVPGTPHFIRGSGLSAQNLASEIECLKDVKIFKTHGLFPDKFEDFVNIVPNSKVINIIRNKEDALFSRFKYAKYHKPCNLVRKVMGDEFFSLSDEESLDLLKKEQTILQSWIDELNTFGVDLNTNNILTLRYERLHGGDVSEFKRLFQFVDSVKSESFIKYFIDKHSFKNYQNAEKARHNSRKGSQLFCRSGKIGDGVGVFC